MIRRMQLSSWAPSKLMMQSIALELRMKEPWINSSFTQHCVRFESLPLPFVNIIAAACLPLFNLFDVQWCFLTVGRYSYTWITPMGRFFPSTAKDKFLWYLNPLLPESLPKPVMQQGRKFDHHVIMEMTEFPWCINPILSFKYVAGNVECLV